MVLNKMLLDACVSADTDVCLEQLMISAVKSKFSLSAEPVKPVIGYS